MTITIVEEVSEQIWLGFYDLHDNVKAHLKFQSSIVVEIACPINFQQTRQTTDKHKSDTFILKFCGLETMLL